MSDKMTELKKEFWSEISKMTTQQNGEAETSSSFALDESLLTNNFDEQLQIIRRSIGSKTDSKPKKVVSKVSKQTPVKEKKDSKLGITGDQKTKQQHNLTHLSTIYHFNEDSDEPIIKKATAHPMDKITDTSSKISNKCPPMPPPFVGMEIPKIDCEDEAQASMLMSWYMAGYHTGYYAAMKKFKEDN